MRNLAIAAASLALALFVAGAAWAQLDFPSELKLENLGPGAASGLGADPVEVSAQYTVDPDGRTGQLRITAQIQPGWHVYSITQKPGGPFRTTIQLQESPAYRLAGEFQPAEEPHRAPEPLFGGLLVESHEEAVTWSAPLRFSPAASLAELTIEGSVRLQACNASLCLNPKKYSFTATRAGAAGGGAATASTAGVQSQTSESGRKAGASRTDRVTDQAGLAELNASPFAAIRGQLEPATVAPGGRATLKISAVPKPGWHVYALEPKENPDKLGSKPTLLTLTNTSGWKYSPPQASDTPLEKPSVIPGETVQYYQGPVEWTVQLEVPAGAAPGQYPIEGLLGYQVCEEDRCDVPRGAAFQGTITVGGQPGGGAAPLAFSEAAYGQASRAAVELPAGPPSLQPATATIPPASVAATERIEGAQTAWAVFGLAFLAGLILNVMPCVLPVIGLKIVGFVHQAGESRGRVLALNVWYSLGLMAVFMALATLAVAFGQGWGQQFQYSGFNIFLIAVVWICALSFLGVWEIPIPGFAMHSSANQVAAREGAAGAFSKGVLTTLLATPCSGPFLAPSLAWAVAQPAEITFATFFFLGLGMASPYLLIGAFPKLIAWLPKPGAWMETFKQAMGFVLLGTVVFIFSFVREELLVPTFALLIGLWAGCWWIGRTPLTAERGRRARAWMVSVMIPVLVGLFAFGQLDRFMSGPKLAWQPYSTALLSELQSSGKTVMVDFTADWCLTCQANKKFVYDTAETKQLIEELGVVPVLADKTDPSPEIEALLKQLGNEAGAIPFLAIFPGNRPSEPLLIDGIVTQSMVSEALRKASAPGPAVAAR